jgi:hypothetical protein
MVGNCTSYMDRELCKYKYMVVPAFTYCLTRLEESVIRNLFGKLVAGYK